MQLLLFLLAGISLIGYSLSRRIGKWWLSEAEYKGYYLEQSLASAVTIVVFVLIFFTLADILPSGYKDYSYYDYYMIHLDTSWYKFILVPSIIIIFGTEFLIRTIINKNDFIYSILNTIFLSLLPLFIANVIANFRLY